MPRHKKEEVKHRLKEVARLYLRGWMQTEIAEKFGVTQGQISQDLQRVYRMWRREAIRDFDKIKERELIKIDNLEKTYWKAWQESDNDARYLSGVQWCVEQRSKIFGINAPEKYEKIGKEPITIEVVNENKNK